MCTSKHEKGLVKIPLLFLVLSFFPCICTSSPSLLCMQKVDLGRVATSMYLLRLPRMKEIVGKNFSNFKQHAIDPLTVPFRHDAAREEERLETLQASLEQRAKLREEREKKKKNEEKKRMEKQNSLYSKSTMKNSGRTKAEKRKARR